VPWKCTTVIVVNWAKIGRSMTDRKFRVQYSLFRSLCIEQEPGADSPKLLNVAKGQLLDQFGNADRWPETRYSDQNLIARLVRPST
jgi:hypothetical protein